MDGVDFDGRRVRRELMRLSGLRFTPENLAGHQEVLARVEPAVLTAAIGQALRECSQFPTPAELLRYVDQARMRAAALAPRPVAIERDIEPVTLDVPIAMTDQHVTVTVTREYQPECEACADSGWRPMWCGRRDTLPFALNDRGVRPNQCGRVFDHAPHEFAVECTCRPTNRTYQRKREQECASARKRTERDGR